MMYSRIDIDAGGLRVKLVDGTPVDYAALPENHRQTVRLNLEYGAISPP